MHPDNFTIIVPPPRHPSEPNEAFRDWLGHVETGRIGGNPPTPPAVAAQRDANTALFARLRHATRR